MLFHRYITKMNSNVLTYASVRLERNFPVGQYAQIECPVKLNLLTTIMLHLLTKHSGNNPVNLLKFNTTLFNLFIKFCQNYIDVINVHIIHSKLLNICFAFILFDYLLHCLQKYDNIVIIYTEFLISDIHVIN